MNVANKIMRVAAWIAGLVESGSDYTLNLQHDTEWLQDAYENGRAFGARSE